MRKLKEDHCHEPDCHPDIHCTCSVLILFNTDVWMWDLEQDNVYTTAYKTLGFMSFLTSLWKWGCVVVFYISLC